MALSVAQGRYKATEAELVAVRREFEALGGKAEHDRLSNEFADARRESRIMPG